MNTDIHDLVGNYYTDKINEHGDTPKGVDWNSSESQEMRFNQLCKIIDVPADFSVLDFGCGYGAMLEYFDQNYHNFRYTGLDISQAMIDHALEKHNYSKNIAWLTQLADNEVFDYTVASGIFNVRMEISDNEWFKYIIDTLEQINNVSQKGFSFNILTSYSDKEYMRDYLYYADPAVLFDYCKRNFSKYVTLLHDYPLYEFTIQVKKTIDE